MTPEELAIELIGSDNSADIIAEYVGPDYDTQKKFALELVDLIAKYLSKSTEER